VDRSGAYAARQLAWTLVEAKLAPRVLVHASYAIGKCEPETAEAWGASRSDADIFFSNWPERLEQYFRPSRMVNDLELTKPGFRRVAAFGHFGRPDLDLPWERVLQAVRLKDEDHWSCGQGMN
jgi:S-adenosylmethionine synthetase